MPPLIQDLLRERFFAVLQREFDEDRAFQDEILSCFLQQPHIEKEWLGYRESVWEKNLHEDGVDARWDEWLEEHGIEP